MYHHTGTLLSVLQGNNQDVNQPVFSCASLRERIQFHTQVVSSFYCLVVVKLVALASYWLMSAGPHRP